MGIAYRFGQVEVRPAERQLYVAGQPAAVGSRAFDLLLALIDRRDRVVTKDELMDLVWPGVVVEENNLQVQVSTLRKLMGARAVATIPGRGYRFTLEPDDDAAPAAPPPRRHNLPAPLNTFIGREAEIGEVAALLERSRLVTLTSVGGTGKTRLSLEVAARCLDRHPDGVWLVELAPVADERRVPQAIASALGVMEEPGLPVDEAIERHVRDKSLLLVLDNCEHVLQAAAGAAKRMLVAAPGVHILASSREPLHVAGEATYRVPAMASDQAIRLFVDRARSANPAFEPGAANAQSLREICRRLDGIPLAIELAAARVRALSVEKIAERLDDCFRLLTGGDQTALPRQRTLRASIDWSHDLLSAPERMLLRRLAVFAGGWTLEAAEAVGGGGEVEQSESVLELLTHLVEKSLVWVAAEARRYHLLETVRQYALERLDESGEAAAIRDRHLAYYLAFAARAGEEIIGPDQAAWMSQLDAERENLLAAHAWCDRAAGGDERGLRLVTSIRQYWLSRGLLSLAYGVMVQALERAPERSRLRSEALFTAGQLAYYMGLYPDARRDLEEALAIAGERGDGQRVASVLQPLGLACLGQGDLAAARGHLEEAVRRAREQEDPRKIAAALNCLAQLHRVEGRLDAAEPLYAHAVDLARGLQDRESVAIGLLNLAMTAVDRGDAAGARLSLREAAAIAAALASSALAQNVLEACAGLASLRGEGEAAARFFGAAEAQAARSGFRRDSADEAFLGAWMARARAGLRDGGFAAAEAAGRSLALDAAFAEASAWLAREG